MSKLILGTWNLNVTDMTSYFQQAFKIGYDQVDCAEIYQNEQAIGNALSKVFTNGSVSREDISLVSKMWNNRHEVSDASISLDKSLSDLKTDYLDCYYLHWPIAWKESVTFPSRSSDFLKNQKDSIFRSYEKLLLLKEAGKILSIGVSNFGQHRVDEIGKVFGCLPDRMQEECHMNLPQHELRDFCKDKGIIFEGYSMLGNERLAKASGLPSLYDNVSIRSNAKKLSLTIAELSLIWASVNQIEALVTTKSLDRLKHNFEIYNLRNDVLNEEIDFIPEMIRYTNAKDW